MRLLPFILASSGYSQDVCPRYAPGSELKNPVNIFALNGYVDVHATYETRHDDEYGLQLYCYMASGSVQSPTLRVSPGDNILFTLTNNAGLASDSKKMQLPFYCGSQTMTYPSTTNIHFHGLHASPDCHVEESLYTVINQGESYTYDLKIPANQPAGLYWYHPHIDGISESALQGGATGAIIVEGIENIQSAVGGLPEQILIFRDYAHNESIELTPPMVAPSFEVTTNFAYNPSPDYVAPFLRVKPEQKQFWRALNSASDAILELQVQYDGIAQPLSIVSFDGVAFGHGQTASLLTKTSILLPPGSRVEFIITTPRVSINEAILYTLFVDTGVEGDYDAGRPLLRIVPDMDAPTPDVIIPSPTTTTPRPRLSLKTPSQTRLLYFSSILADPTDPNSDTIFFITVDGQKPQAFSMESSLSLPPSVIVEAGTVEDWIIENRAMESHVFHIHQLHFLLTAQNKVHVSADEQQYLDNILIPSWDGVSAYPSVTLRMKFSEDIIGRFMYHCHILEHEDKGMLAVIEVVPKGSLTSTLSEDSLRKEILSRFSPSSENILVVAVGVSVAGIALIVGLISHLRRKTPQWEELLTSPNVMSELAAGVQHEESCP